MEQLEHDLSVGKDADEKAVGLINVCEVEGVLTNDECKQLETSTSFLLEISKRATLKQTGLKSWFKLGN